MPTQSVSFTAPTDYGAEQEKIARQRRMAELLQQESMKEAPAGQMAGGYFVPTSPLTHLAKVLQGVNARSEMARADKASDELGRLRTQKMVEALGGMPQARTEQEPEPMGLPQGSEPPVLRTVQPTMADNAQWLAQLSQFGPGAVNIGTGLIGMQQREKEAADQRQFRADEATAARQARIQELEMRLADARLQAADRAALQRELAQQRADLQRELQQGQIQAREDMTRLAASLRPPPQPQAPVAIVGPDGQPVLVPPSQAYGQRPALKPDERKVQREEDMAVRRAEVAVSRADMVINKIDEALRQSGPMTTGLTGAALGVIPGTGAYDLGKTVDTIKANIGFQELQAMREASPTGGALGQVAIKELDMLQAVLANLDKNQSRKQLEGNLRQARQHFQNWRNAMQQQAGQTPNEAPQPAQPERKSTVKWGDLGR